jgi:hypothetical protein
MENVIFIKMSLLDSFKDEGRAAELALISLNNFELATVLFDILSRGLLKFTYFYFPCFQMFVYFMNIYILAKYEWFDLYYAFTCPNGPPNLLNLF